MHAAGFPSVVGELLECCAHVRIFKPISYRRNTSEAAMPSEIWTLRIDAVVEMSTVIWPIIFCGPAGPLMVPLGVMMRVRLKQHALPGMWCSTGSALHVKHANLLLAAHREADKVTANASCPHAVPQDGHMLVACSGAAPWLCEGCCTRRSVHGCRHGPQPWVSQGPCDRRGETAYGDMSLQWVTHPLTAAYLASACDNSTASSCWSGVQHPQSATQGRTTVGGCSVLTPP